MYSNYLFNLTVLLVAILPYVSCNYTREGNYTAWPKALKDAELKDGEPIPTLRLGSTPYLVYRKRLGVMEAETVCATTIGRLAVFLDKTMAKQVIDEIVNISSPFSPEYDEAVREYEFGMDRRYWIGLSDLQKEGDWVWMNDGTKLDYTDLWYEDQPDHLRTGRLEHCVTLWNPSYYEGEHHSWNDEACEHKLYFICEDLTQ